MHSNLLIHRKNLSAPSPKAPSRFINALFRSLLALSFLFCWGCSEIGYYGQATHGQLSLLFARDDIHDIIKNKQTDKLLRKRLTHLLKAREFAESQLSLPVGSAYLDYVDLKRPYVIWNITAAEEFSLRGFQWCYPVIGCQSYRGYFDEKSAIDFASKLETQGLEIWVNGVDAYSTLGWFDDPVLNTFFKRNDTGIAALLFHELAHRVVYIDGDTAFNESFASSVELAGIKLWMTAQGTPERYDSFIAKKTTQKAFISLVLKTHKELQTIYHSELTVEDKRQKKSEAIEHLRSSFSEAAKHNPRLKGYSHWINSEINNAKLVTIANYHQYIESFSQLLIDNEHDFDEFYQAVAQLGEKEKEARILELQRLKERYQSRAVPEKTLR